MPQYKFSASSWFYYKEICYDTRSRERNYFTFRNHTTYYIRSVCKWTEFRIH